ncbi:MAG: hypothetical protein JSS35_19000 [Proteobacteria bacterium]|nr:hypothetical protein [Pseudomonadota bacterium]
MRPLVAIALLAALAPEAALAASPAAGPPLADAVPTNVVLHPTADGVELKPTTAEANAEHYATLPGADFADGVIEADLKADVIPGSTPDIRAFVGLAFRLNPRGYEAFYLRMKNGRAHDQLQRNHSTQYISYPDYPWERLRKESPGAYESYVDLAPGRWTHMKLVICGAEARLFVDGAAQPVLVVHDLKHGPASRGRTALWIGPGTDATFRAVSVTPDARCVVPD